jgi:hypothetical protein
MNSEVSRYDIVELRNANSSLENELRRIHEELRRSIHEQELRNIKRSGEVERSLTKWTALIVVISIVFTLAVTHERRAGKGSSTVGTSNTE